MNYQDVVQDFVTRTKKNLEVIEKLQDDHKPRTGEIDQEEIEVYEVTQLVNSLVGLLIFPKEAYFDQIPKTPIREHINKGWPSVLAGGTDPDKTTLQDVIRFMRNAIAHFNVEFIPDGQNRIESLKIWNKNNSGIKNWETILSLYELRDTVNRFLGMLMLGNQK
jgi:hypothetical protein